MLGSFWPRKEPNPLDKLTSNERQKVFDRLDIHDDSLVCEEPTKVFKKLIELEDRIIKLEKRRKK